MLKHCVFTAFKADVAEEQRQEILGSFAELVDVIPGMVGYDFGPNLDYEDKSGRYQGGFIVTFEDREAHLQYEKNPRHIELGGQLVSMCEGGADGIIVFDLKV